MDIDSKTEKQFLEWLYEVIRDDEIDYMWDICGRIGELKAKESVDNAKSVIEKKDFAITIL